ncbi:hypothetical protein JW926_13735, partial [Candidatus Sumerlaeota bacterium]|nr:hypothetical protein [Candidatus Sumerlaeota bacterium]
MSNFVKTLSLILLIIINSIGSATTYHVKNDGDDASSGTSWKTAFKTILHSLDVSETGDEIWVKEGIYKEGKTIDSGGVSLYGGFAGTETDLSQRNFRGHQTAIDGEDSYQCIRNSGLCDGFHIVNGYNEDGAGVDNTGIVQNCFIYNNVSIWGGGGVENDNITSSCVIYNNSAWGGGGIYNRAFGKVEHCIVFGNTAECGGGIYNDSGIIQNSVIRGNSIYDTGGGEWNRAGGIWQQNGIIHNCLIYDNTGRNCGGICNKRGYVINCTVYSNSSDEYGGIANTGVVYNCISWNNQYCDIMNETYTHTGSIHISCFGEANPDDNDNIRTNPQFVNTSGDPSTWDFHLKNGSACIDRGRDVAFSGIPDLFPEYFTPEMDIEGRERPGSDNKICMGAYESPDYYEPSLLSIPTKRFYVSKNGNNMDGSSWENAFTSITMALSRASGGEMYEIWVKEGIYNEKSALIIPGMVNLIGGFAGNE